MCNHIISVYDIKSMQCLSPIHCIPFIHSFILYLSFTHLLTTSHLLIHSLRLIYSLTHYFSFTHYVSFTHSLTTSHLLINSLFPSHKDHNNYWLFAVLPSRIITRTTTDCCLWWNYSYSQPVLYNPMHVRIATIQAVRNDYCVTQMCVCVEQCKNMDRKWENCLGIISDGNNKSRM